MYMHFFLIQNGENIEQFGRISVRVYYASLYT
jgi:hypothetical protein